MNKALTLVILLITLTTVLAFPISTNETVEVYEKGSFYVEIANPTPELKDLEINLYSPSEVKINAPSKLAPNTNVTAKITLTNNYESYREITSKLEVKLGEEVETKNVTFKFYAQEGTKDNPVVGMFGVGLFAAQTSSFTIAEWVGFWVLVILAAVFLIALAARIYNRT